ncbi:phage baseplate protein [Serratia fonticola]|uniref:Phage baseplate protein n=1 Tax=Serratia fonticola TaxID=47917 RepID=A0AAE7EHE3_SERFO|nr:phage baseplate protein [Serratia fonticola]QKJ58798.1 phage baseplate protein [Serratia fonticola]
MSNSQKIPLNRALAAYQKRWQLAERTLEGKSMPCHVTAVSGSIVTVMFDILPGDFNIPEITIPVFGPEYIRYPIQVGDKGVTISASVSIKNASGLGVGLPNMSLPPSLTALYFMPISNVEWSPQDGKKVVVYGPEGVICKDEAGTATVIIEKDKVTINAKDIYLNGQRIHLNAQVVQDADQIQGDATARLIGPLHVENDTTAGGISLTGHKHDVINVEPGSSTRTSEKPQ